MSKRITKRAVEVLQPTDKDVFAWDSEVKGFGVRCRPSGAKFYVLKFRIGGRQRWYTIGRHGSPWTAEQARAEALRLLGQKAEGKDPAAERDGEKNAITIRELAERFLTHHVAAHLKAKTADDYAHIVNKVIIPAIGHHKITDLSRKDVSHLHHNNRSRPYLANRTLAVLSKMMNLAEEWGLRPDSTNPCRHVKKFQEDKRKRYLTTDELKRLGSVLTAAEKENTAWPYFFAAIRLLILTGARLTEITTLKWEDVDFESGLLRLRDSKTGAREIVLNKPALDVLRAIARVDKNPYVIVGRNPGQHLVEVQKPWQRLRKQAGLEDVRIHDLRHSFASVAVASGMSLPLIGKLLGHTQTQTTARYAHLALDPQREASDEIGSRISQMMSPQGRPA